MDFEINAFVSQLRKNMYVKFPYERDFINKEKHKGREEHIRDVAFDRNPTLSADDGILYFEIGNEYSEERYPYYHILEDAPVIRKKDRGTDKTKGSQAKIEKVSERDYGIVNWNGKTFTKEYSRNIRGQRSRVVDKATRFVKIRGKRYRYNADSNSYKNIHYRYIENMLSEILPLLASEFNMKYVGTSSSGLQEEYFTDNLNVGVVGYDEMSQIISNMIDL